MTDTWTDRSFGWLISIGFHVTLLVGLTMVVTEQFVQASGSVSVGIRCAIVERESAIDRIEPFVFDRSSLDASCNGLSADDPVALLAEELASVFKRGEPSSGCILCKAENRHGKVLLPPGIGPAGLCCRHVMMLESGPSRERCAEQ